MQKKEGYPEEGDLVLCTVKKVLFHSVFVDLDEYKNKEGFIHISEVAPGRIRNIRDYVKENKKIVCKVLKIDESKGHIDLSLRRVSVSMKKKKNTEFKQEQKAEKILDVLSRESKTPIEKIYEEVGNQIIEKYGSLFEGFQDILEDQEKTFSELKVNKMLLKKLATIIKERIKAPQVTISGDLNLLSYSGTGIVEIKSILKEITKPSKNYSITIQYISAPKYKVTVTSSNYKDAEKGFEYVEKIVEDFSKKPEGESQLKRL